MYKYIKQQISKQLALAVLASKHLHTILATWTDLSSSPVFVSRDVLNQKVTLIHYVSESQREVSRWFSYTNYSAKTEANLTVVSSNTHFNP